MALEVFEHDDYRTHGKEADACPCRNGSGPWSGCRRDRNHGQSLCWIKNEVEHLRTMKQEIQSLNVLLSQSHVWTLAHGTA